MKFKKFTTTVKIKRNRPKRISPFLLLEGFVIFFWFPYLLIKGSVGIGQLILFPVILVYALFADVVIWKLFAGKNKGLIWIIESVISALVIFWII